MSITFPLSTASFADLVRFDAGSRLWLPHDHQQLSNLASGGTIAKDLRQRLWQADVVTTALNTDDYTTLEAVLDSLDGSTNTFYLYDPKRKYPKQDPTGSTLSALNITNLCLWSEDYTNAVWTHGNSTNGTTTNAGPFGTATATKIQEDATTNVHYIQQQFSGLANSTTYTVSAYVAAAERSWCALFFRNKAGSTYSAYFHLSGSGTVGTTAGSPAAAIDGTNPLNSFYKIQITGNSSTGASTPDIILYIATADNTNNYAGTAGNGIKLGGIQLETGSTASIYTRSQGTAGTSQARIASLTGTTACSIKGLPSGYVITAGDRLHLDDANSVRQYVEALETVTASSVGTTGSFAVAPYFLSGVAVDQAVTFSKPAAKMCLKPGTRDNSTGVMFSSHKFQAVQVLS